mmetsp:Transcript_113451/g.284154  ORF Transcript_113451/g.284154 Transcript_113451/m.284154 type:complete len:213 (-) Transcript_113451:111-749(-)
MRPYIIGQPFMMPSNLSGPPLPQAGEVDKDRRRAGGLGCAACRSLYGILPYQCCSCQICGWAGGGGIKRGRAVSGWRWGPSGPDFTAGCGRWNLSNCDRLGWTTFCGELRLRRRCSEGRGSRGDRHRHDCRHASRKCHGYTSRHTRHDHRHSHATGSCRHLHGASPHGSHGAEEHLWCDTVDVRQPPRQACRQTALQTAWQTSWQTGLHTCL